MAISQTDFKDMMYYWLYNCGTSFETIKIGNDTLYGRAGTALKIDRAYDGNGGWEPRAQVEIATLIATKYSATHKVTREEQIYYGTTQATDLVIRSSGNALLQILELKCERKTMPKGIVGAVQDDVIKLKKQLKPEYQGVSCFAVGISCTDAGAAAVKNGNNWPYYVVHWQECGKTPAGRPILVFWVDLSEVKNI